MAAKLDESSTKVLEPLTKPSDVSQRKVLIVGSSCFGGSEPYNLGVYETLASINRCIATAVIEGKVKPWKGENAEKVQETDKTWLKSLTNEELSSLDHKTPIVVSNQITSQLPAVVKWNQLHETYGICVQEFT